MKLDGRWGYINKSGTMVVKPRFERALGFSQGRARVRVGDKWGYIDRKGVFTWQPTR